MESNKYSIDVLHYLHPHLIWVEVLDTASRNKTFHFEQIGIYGILPLENDFNITEETVRSEIGTEWTPAANKLMTDAFSEAIEIRFSPIYIDRRSSIFDSNIHKYGDITIIQKDGKKKKLSKILKKSCIATYDENSFLLKLTSGKLNTNLNHFQTLGVITVLEKKISENDECNKQWKSSIRNHTSVFHSAHDAFDQMTKSLLTEKNLQIHNKKTEELNDILSEKYQTLKDYCKDIDGISMGRGTLFVKQRPNVDHIESHKSKILEKHLAYKKMTHKNDTKAKPVVNHTIDTDKVLKATKEKLLETIKKSAIEREHVVLNSANDYVKESKLETKNSDTNKNIIPHTELSSIHISKNDELLINGRQMDEYHDTKDDVKIKKIEENTTEIVEGLGSRKNSTCPIYNEKTEKLVFYGPPGVKLDKLNVKVVPKDTYIAPVPNRQQDLREIGINSNKNLWTAIDSDLNYTIKDREKLKDIYERTINQNEQINTDKVGRIESINKLKEVKSQTSSTNSDNSKCSLSNTYSDENIVKKILMLKRSKQSTCNISSDTNTSVKDVSSSSMEDPPLQHKHPESQLQHRDQDTSSSLKENQIHGKCGSESSSAFPWSVEESDIKVEPLKITQKPQRKSTPYDQAYYQMAINNSRENYVNPFRNIEVSEFVEKLVNPILMVHTKNNLHIQPILDLRDFTFNKEINSALKKLSIIHPMMLQTVSWFTILRGYSIFMISPMFSGKTLGYLPAVCRLIPDQNNSELQDFCGPTCIIVCATSKSVADVAKLCKLFIGAPKTVLYYYAGLDEKTFITQLMNGCEILVSTPCGLVRLMTVADFGVDLRRLSVFVMDDCERLNDLYANELKFSITKIKKEVDGRVNRERKVQIVVASRIWCDFMEPLAKWAPNSTICIGCFPECVLYSKARISMDLLQKEKKVDAAVQFMKDVDITKKTVIVCTRDEEVAVLQNRLKQENYHTFFVDGSMNVESLQILNQNWTKYSNPVLGPILICCDGNLMHLNITDAHNLLHYSMPDLYSTFCRRFSALVDHYSSIFKENNHDESVIKIFVEEENKEQLPRILHFIKRCNKEMPELCNEILYTLSVEKDRLKAQKLVPLCDNFLSISECPDYWSCRLRHTIFNEHDEPPLWVPKFGTITFAILHIQNAVLYSARLLSHTQNGELKRYSQNYNILGMKMAAYYSNENNRRPHGIPKLGDICTVAVTPSSYGRCQIVKVLTLNDKGDPDLLLLKLIDEEKWETAKDIHLFHLPEELKGIPTHVVQIRLAGIQPTDRDLTFSYQAEELVKNLINSEDELYVRAEVVLAIGTTLIVDNIEVCQDLGFYNRSTVARCNIKNELLKVHALLKDDHVTKLLKIVNEAGLPLQDNKDIISNNQTTIERKEIINPCWAHLNKDDVSSVYFASAENLSKFFLRLVKFQDCLDLLTEDIQQYVLNKKCDVIIPKKGEFVLAKFPDDGLYYRARIEEIYNKRCQCFFVDHGDWRTVSTSNIISIIEQFITTLPFQAIECRLIGIKPAGEEWTEYSTNWFYNHCFLDKSEKLKEMYVKYFTTESAECTGGIKYGVVMIDTTGPEDVIINQTMLDANLAQPDYNEIQYLSKIDWDRPAIKTDSDSDWEKEATPYKDDHYQRRSVPGRIVRTPVDNKFHNMAVKPYTLIASDDDSIGSKDFDEQLTQEDIKALCSQLTKTTCKDKKMQLVSDYHVDNKCLRDLTPEPIVKIDKTVCIKGNRASYSTSRLSDFEISSSKISEALDSDDCTSPENVSQSTEAEIETKAALKPKLCWRQTKTTVTFKIEISGVENYTINITENTLKFLTVVNDIKYAFQIELYGTIKPKLSKHEGKGLYVLVKLQKLISKNWLSLTCDDEMKRWIVFDTDFIACSDDDDKNSICKEKQLWRKYVESTHYAEESEIESDIEFVDDISHRYKRESD